MPETGRRAMNDLSISTTLASLSGYFSGYVQACPGGEGRNLAAISGSVAAECLTAPLLLRRLQPCVYAVHTAGEPEPRFVLFSRRRRRRDG